MKLGLVGLVIAGALAQAACGGGSPVHVPPLQDASGNDGVCSCACSVLTQAGCDPGQKCTWVLATDATPDAPGLGANECAPDGQIPLGGACTTRPVAMGGYDDCVAGAICVAGTCALICSSTLGEAPTCPTGDACQTHDGLFANTGSTTTPAGACTPSCDPLADNDFDGSGTAHTKTGAACGSDPLVGCYALPGDPSPTVFTCMPTAAASPSLTHRAQLPPGPAAINSCMPGYLPATSTDGGGAMAFECFALCKPGNAFANNPGAQAPNGVAPHGCNATDAEGNFGAIPDGSATSNGEHCMYSWRFEVDSANAWHPSATSDSVGLCVDHTRHRWDSNHDGTIDMTDALFPPCAALPLATSPFTLGAEDLGCVSTSLAHPPAASVARWLRLGIVLPELR